jgi:hypothetical protein
MLAAVGTLRAAVHSSLLDHRCTHGLWDGRIGTAVNGEPQDGCLAQAAAIRGFKSRSSRGFGPSGRHPRPRRPRRTWEDRRIATGL